MSGLVKIKPDGKGVPFKQTLFLTVRGREFPISRPMERRFSGRLLELVKKKCENLRAEASAARSEAEPLSRSFRSAHRNILRRRQPDAVNRPLPGRFKTGLYFLSYYAYIRYHNSHRNLRISATFLSFHAAVTPFLYSNRPLASCSVCACRFMSDTPRSQTCACLCTHFDFTQNDLYYQLTASSPFTT